MHEKETVRRAIDAVGTAAVVPSLVYVGVQVRQNTRAIQTSTSQSAALFKTSMAKIGVPRREELEDQLNALIVLIDRRITELGPK